ncbi:putative [histone H3]-lysine(4) N-trimethyltransferase chromatin remodeling SET family [Helianthus annuus]|nr:putative [histone H3]-lysine(4) N-trimethyltransferase chromatin remodeling SET family [Helianthus annuus]
MAPNPRVAKAFRAMKDIGIPEEKTKPVLKNLLKIYEKNWELIEAENYRALADAIFDSEEAEASETKKKDDNAEAEAAEQKKKLEEAERMKVIEEETQIPEEPERPLKRLRLRHQDGTPLKKPKLEIDDLPYAIPRSQARAEAAKEKQPVLADTQPDVANESLSESGLRLRHLRNKGKEPISPQTDDQELRSSSHRPSHGVRFKEPKPKETALSLIKPKDEPVTDDTLPPSAPLSVVRPGSSINGLSSTENNLPTEANENSNNSVVPASSNERSGRELATIPDESIVNLDVASSSSGEIKISVTCIKNPNLSVTNVDALLKKMEDKCLRSYKILDSNFSLKKLMNDICDSLLDTDPEPDYTPPAEPLENGAVDISTNGSVDQQINQLTADDLKSVHDINDIAKGQESVIISLVNEVNTECPPAFHYIPGNAVFQNASVNLSLARIGDDNCCSACFGDCLTSASSCVCALQAGGEFAYTKEGLVKEELLDECVNMNRDPQKHCLLYCKECPLERSKNEETVGTCKGHLDRSFIKECWLKCGCNKQCGNRVVQRGIQRKLQVFMTPGGKGWGLRTLEDLPKGAFVCEYVGEILTNAEYYDRVSKNSNKDEHAYLVLLDADWGEESEIKDEEALCLDATYCGNVARFINHRCFDSNLVEIPVEIENPDHHYYHIAFFTTRKVKALEELTWDYGIDFDDEEHHVKAFRCQCGSRFCRNNKRPTRSRKTRYT